MADILAAAKMKKQAENRAGSPQRPGSPGFGLAERLPGLEALLQPEPALEVQGPSGRIYHDRSIFCLRPADQPRRAAIFFVEWRWFDPFILFVIIANCSSMAWESPLDPPGTSKADLIDVLEIIYLYVFTVELLSKVLAYGFVMHPHSYLRDAWCQLDFVVVSLAWLPILFPSFGNYSVIRSVRALRPLRALKRVPGMPVLISSIMAAMPKLGNAMARTTLQTPPHTLSSPSGGGSPHRFSRADTWHALLTLLPVVPRGMLSSPFLPC